MIKALLLIFDPDNTWEKIQQNSHSVASVFLTYLLPLLLLGTAVETWGMMKLGYDKGRIVERRVKLEQDLAVRYAGAQICLGLLTAVVGAFLFKKVTQGFHRRHSFKETFATLSYSLGPVYLVRMFDGLPGVNTWICWGLGAILGAAVLYRGVPRVLRPDPSNALGVYLTCSFLFFALTGVAHYVAQLVLQEKILAQLHFA
ncbi:MAG TPA: Yip1 family protein [Verrucomicrobiae bacterium]|nr:Yip1 family protein [Verrucomicrobiae bacterium]